MSFDVGIGNEPSGVGIGAVGYELENVNSLQAEAKINGRLKAYDHNAFVGFNVDYHTPEGYSKRVALSLGMYSTDRGHEHTPYWGKGANADQYVDLGAWRSGILNLKEWAPPGWDGKVWFSVLLQHSGKNTSMTGRIAIPGLIGEGEKRVEVRWSGLSRQKKGVFKVDSGLLLWGVAERSERSERSEATPHNSCDPSPSHTPIWYTSHGVWQASPWCRRSWL